jgi:hypothetical protein
VKGHSPNGGDPLLALEGRLAYRGLKAALERMPSIALKLLLDPLFYCLRWHGAALACDLSSICEQYHRRDASDAMAAGYAGKLLRVQLQKPEARLKGLRRRLEMRRHLKARPAPRSPEIDEDRKRGL